MGDRDDEETARRSPEPTENATPRTTAAAHTEPSPTPEPIPTLELVPAFEPIQLSGTGNSVPRFDIPADSAAIADITHTGASNFAIWTVGEAGGQEDLLVNVIGNYAGTVLFDEAMGSHSVAFEIDADGAWTILIKPITDAFRWDGTEVLTGTGDDVVILDPPSSGLSSVSLTHQGEGNFAIWAYGPTTDLLVNEIGQFSGEVLLADRTLLLEISATGPWTVSPPG